MLSKKTAVVSAAVLLAAGVLSKPRLAKLLRTKRAKLDRYVQNKQQKFNRYMQGLHSKMRLEVLPAYTVIERD